MATAAEELVQHLVAQKSAQLSLPGAAPSLPAAYAACLPAAGLQVPDKYIVVERMDAVEMHFVFVYSDDSGDRPAAAHRSPQRAASGGGGGGVAVAQGAPAGAAPGQRRSPLLYMVLLYLAWMVYVSLRDNWPFLRRVLRRRYGVRF